MIQRNAVKVVCALPHFLRPDEKDRPAAVVEQFPHGTERTSIRPGFSETFDFEAGTWMVVRKTGRAPVQIINQMPKTSLELRLRDHGDDFDITDTLSPRSSAHLDVKGEYSVRL